MPNTLLVSKHFPAVVHRALLLSGGIELAHAFWSKHALEVDGFALDPISFARYISDDAAQCPMSFVGEVMSTLELFLIEHDISVPEFCDLLMPHANGGSHVDAKLILALASPFWSLLSRVSDPHRMFLRMCHLTCRTFLPELIIEELGGTRPPEGVRTGYLALGFAALWRGELRAWDPSLFMTRMLQRMPASLGLEPFVSIRCIADARSPRELAGPGARAVSFHAFCHERGVRLPRADIPDLTVMQTVDDVYCPLRKRVVLHAGAVCGAPIYLFELQWQVDRSRIHGAFQHLIREALGRAEPSADDLRARALQQAFAGHARRRIVARFDHAEQRMYVDDAPVARGVPALILLHCLQAHVTTGQTQFTFRELKSEAAIISHPKNTGFEVRLRRLRDILQLTSCGIWIEHSRRGQFNLVVHGDLSLELGVARGSDSEADRHQEI